MALPSLQVFPDLGFSAYPEGGESNGLLKEKSQKQTGGMRGFYCFSLMF